MSYTCANGISTLNVNSIGDSGKVIFGLGGTTPTFALNSGATSGLTFSANGRQFEIAGTGAIPRIANYSTQAFTINSDLLVSGTGTRTLQLYGTGAPASLATLFSTFSGTDGTSSVSSSSLVTGQGQFGYTGNTLTWTVVPEPTSALAGILLGAGLLRRRRRQSVGTSGLACP